MRAAQITAWREPLLIGDLPDPAPPRGGVVIRVLACGVCRSDWHAWTGADPDVNLPHVPGHEFCGEIVAVSAGVRRWKPGDRVIAPFILGCGGCQDCAAGNQTTCADQAVLGFNLPGAFAELVAVPYADSNLTALPETMDPAEAAALGCRATTAWQALVARAQIRPGEWLAIFGGGGVGIAALLLGRALGARVVVVDVSDEKLNFASQLGADAVVNAAQIDAAAAVREVTNGGAHVAIEALGIAETMTDAMRSLRKLGRLVMIGMPAGSHTRMTLPMDVLYAGQLTIQGTRGMPSWRYPDLLNLIQGGQVDLSPMVTRHIGLSGLTTELQAFDNPAPPGVAVVTNMLA